MNDFGGGYYGGASAGSVSRLQQQYWATKQTLLRKIGRKEDDCVVASDAELDAKLELFGSIQQSCTTLLRVLEAYQDRLLVLSQEENALGRFLKECGKQDKTRAGKMMQATGKTMSFSAQQRLTLRVPLVRLYQEVETYESRAVADTQMTVSKMEKCRTEYRGGLLWMKDVSQQLNPDTHRNMEKFRKVQGHVKRCKTRFDRLKVDTLQKVDLLAASRCNMFSHVLAAYQAALLQFWEKTSTTMQQVADSFKGYQHFEFVVVKELAEPSRRLAEEMGSNEKSGNGGTNDRDKDMFFNSEYSDVSPPQQSSNKWSEESMLSGKADEDDEPLLLSSTEAKSTNLMDDLLAAPGDASGDAKKDDMQLLQEILEGAPVPADGSFAAEWTSAFGGYSSATTTPLAGDNMATPATTPLSLAQIPMIPPPPGGNQHNTSSYLLPSQLLDMDSVHAQMQALNVSNANSALSVAGSTSSSTSGNNGIFLQQQMGQSGIPFMMQTPPMLGEMKANTMGVAPLLPTTAGAMQHQQPMKQQASTSKKAGGGDMSAWFNLFADLDPLANPDAIGKKKDEQDRSC